MITSKWLLPWRMLCLCMAVGVYPGYAEDSTVESERGDLEGKLQQRVDMYKASYPEIMFVNMKGGEDLIANMMTLDILLGHQPSSLDYEHTPELRKDLMLVSANRIMDMLKLMAPSASLFKADDPLGWQENICVLTINPEAVASDAMHATRSLLARSHEFVKSVPADMRLPAGDFLVFIIDHEAYHCLQSLYVGPQPMSDHELWGEYHHYLNELGADAYALIMHIRDKGKLTPFVKNVQRIRGTALSTADPNHLTCIAAEKVMQMQVDDIVKMNEREVFDAAVSVKNQLSIDYPSYEVYLASAVAAMNQLGIDAELPVEVVSMIENIAPNPAKVKTLIENTRRCLEELTVEDRR